MTIIVKLLFDSIIGLSIGVLLGLLIRWRLNVWCRKTEAEIEQMRTAYKQKWGS